MKNRSGKIPRSSEFHVLSTDFPCDLVFLIEWARTLPNGNSRERSLKIKIACSFALEDSPSRRLWPSGATTFPTVIHNDNNDILPLCDLQAANKNKCVARLSRRGNPSLRMFSPRVYWKRMVCIMSAMHIYWQRPPRATSMTQILILCVTTSKSTSSRNMQRVVFLRRINRKQNTKFPGMGDHTGYVWVARPLASRKGTDYIRIIYRHWRDRCMPYRNSFPSIISSFEKYCVSLVNSKILNSMPTAWWNWQINHTQQIDKKTCERSEQI